MVELCLPEMAKGEEATRFASKTKQGNTCVVECASPAREPLALFHHAASFFI
jgi:hypothetical protein